jgi:uncharacterized membrane protein
MPRNIDYNAGLSQGALRVIFFLLAAIIWRLHYHSFIVVTNIIFTATLIADF